MWCRDLCLWESVRRNEEIDCNIKLGVCGVVQESQCDCGAGVGPETHCKHVCVILYALTTDAEGTICSETCTQKLQTFYHVKTHWLSCEDGTFKVAP